MPFHNKKLNDGTSIPPIAFGSSGISHPQTVAQIQQAIDVGFRHVDTAQGYGNEHEVGDAVRTHPSVPREQIWVTTKFSRPETDWPLSACRKSLDAMGLEYVDLYLIHFPGHARGDIPGCWKEMEEVKKRGWAKSIGVSNFSISDLTTLLASATIPPSVNQIHLDPNDIADTQPLLDFMHDKGIVAEGYSSIGPIRGRGSADVRAAIEEVARGRRVESEVICLAWAEAKGAVIVTKSSSADRLKRYLSVGDVHLNDSEVERIDQAGRKAHSDAQRRARLLQGAQMCLGAGLLVGALLYKLGVVGMATAGSTY